MEDPDRVSNAVNIFMFPDLFLASGTEASLVARRWDTALDSNTLTFYANTAALMTKQRILKIVGWEGVANTPKQCPVLLNLILGPPALHLVVHELSVLVEATEEVSTRVCV